MKIVDMTTAEFQAKKDGELKKAVLDGLKTEKGGVKEGDGALQGRPNA
jgi:hypothetical protein